MCKLLHTAASEDKDPKTELYNYLLHYRATPHSTTGRSPAELLVDHKLQTKLSQIFTVKECDDLKDVMEHHDERDHSRRSILIFTNVQDQRTWQ